MLSATLPEKHTSAFRRLLSDVRAVVQTQAPPQRIGAAVAELLKPHLGSPDLLAADELEPDHSTYRQHILHVEPDGSFSIVALVWLPGQSTPIHDHVSWCVVGVHLGEESETDYELAGDAEDLHLRVTGRITNPAGSVAALVPPGDIHDVKNAGPEPAVSLHIYGADISVLGSSIRRRYNLEIR